MKMSIIIDEVKYSVGDEIQLTGKMDDPRPVDVGTTGTIITIDDMNQLHIHWTTGRLLAVIPNVDSFKLIKANLEY